MNMINIQNEVQKIHHQYGASEIANYKIQLLCEQYAKEYHDSVMNKLNMFSVIKSGCPKCGSNDTERTGETIYFCHKCKFEWVN